jgi:hypothetical protein
LGPTTSDTLDPMRAGGRRLVAVSAILVASCSVLYDPDDSSPARTDAGSVTADAEGAGALPVVLPPGPRCPGAGLSCIPVAPAGWSGPFIVYDGNPANTPACPAAEPAIALEGHRGLVTNGAHTCTACECGSPKSVRCEAAILTTWATPDCTGANIDPRRVESTCQATPMTYPGSHSIVGVVAGGSCDPKQATVASKPAPIFAFTTRVCGAELVSDGCNTGFVCASDPLPPFNERHCVTQRGDVTCPGAPYNVKTTTFARVDDRRGCLPCTCGGVTGAQCTGSIEGFFQDACTGGTTTAAYPSGCIQGLPAYVSLKVPPGTPSGGSCSPSGGGPTGTVTLTDVVTICCAP